MVAVTWPLPDAPAVAQRSSNAVPDSSTRRQPGTGLLALMGERVSNGGSSNPEFWRPLDSSVRMGAPNAMSVPTGDGTPVSGSSPTVSGSVLVLNRPAPVMGDT